jgi:tetratricopeptide (TPR) repeat protein
MPAAREHKAAGLAAFRADRLDEAAERFTAAAEAFAAAGEPVEAAEARNNLAVVRLALKDWPGALAAVSGTPETFRAAGDRLREAQALANRAAALDGAGDLEAAAEDYVTAIEIFSELGETETRAACWKALSALQIKQDKKLQALASMQAGLNLTPKLSAREKTLKGLIDKAFKLMNGRS